MAEITDHILTVRFDVPSPKRSARSAGRSSSNQPHLTGDQYVTYRLAISREYTRRWLASCAVVAVVAVTTLGVFLPIYVSAGEQTDINYIVSWSSHILLNIAAAGMPSWWALSERRMRLKERKEKDERIAALERRLDPQRTSSGLDESGARLEEED